VTADEVTNGARPHTLRCRPSTRQVTLRLPCGTAGVIPVMAELVARLCRSVFPAPDVLRPRRRPVCGLRHYAADCRFQTRAAADENFAEPNAQQGLSSHDGLDRLLAMDRQSTKEAVTDPAALSFLPHCGPLLPGGNVPSPAPASRNRGTQARTGTRPAPYEPSRGVLSCAENITLALWRP